MCHAAAPTEAQITADIESHLARITVPEPLVEWTHVALDWWVEQERANGVALVRQREAELHTAEEQQRRLTDLLVAGVLAVPEYTERKAAEVDHIQQLHRAIQEPNAELESWRTRMRGVLNVGSTLLDAFRAGDDADRRALLGRVYENLTVTDRIAKPALRNPFSVLEETPNVRQALSAGDANPLPPPRQVLSHRKNARPRDARERALLAWCTKLKEAQTRPESIQEVRQSRLN
jgi:hypothetical protein